MIEIIQKHQLILYPIIPFLGAILAFISSRTIIARNISILFSIINFIIVIVSNKTQNTVYNLGGWTNYTGINFHILDYSWVLIVTVIFIFMFVLIFCHSDLENFISTKYKESKKYLIYSLLQLAQSGFIGILVTQDFFTLYVFIEISSLSSYVLLSIGSSRKSLVSALDYLILGTIGATFILVGIGIILKTTGHLNMIMSQKYVVASKAFQCGIIFYIIGTLLKLAFFPIHSWMINAYKNTFSVILMYMGSVSSLVAAYILYKVIYLFNDSSYIYLCSAKQFLYYLSGLVIVFFSYCAYIEKNFRKVLLFSSVMYSGYIVNMVISDIPSSLIYYYLIILALTKLGLFYSITIIEKYNNLEDLSLDSLVPNRSSKLFTLFYTILILSNAGLPLTSGFIAKMLLIKESIDHNKYYTVATIILSSSIALLYNYNIWIPIVRGKISSINILTNKVENFGMLLILITQIILVLYPNYIGNIVTFLVLSAWSNIFIYGIVLIFAILSASFIKRSLRLGVLISFSTLYAIYIGIIAYKYFTTYYGEMLHILSYKIGHFEFISFSIDQFSIIYLTLLSILWPISLLWSSSYLKSLQYQKNSSRFIFFVSLSIISASFIAISGNLITMFTFYEILSISTIPLIIYNNTDRAFIALNKYFKLLFLPSTLFFLSAIFIVYFYTNDISFKSDNGILQNINLTEIQIFVILLLFILGISKLATFPFFSWLPESMVALHPVSGILHAVAIVNSGVFCFAKIIIYVFGFSVLRNFEILQYLLIIPLITILYASFTAFLQKDIKQILAYSTIAQMNIMLTSILSFNISGVWAAMFYMVTHSFIKLFLFLKASDIYIYIKSNKLSDIRGFATYSRLLYFTIFIAILALSGAPILPHAVPKKQILNVISQSYGNLSLYSHVIISLSGLIGFMYLSRILSAMKKTSSSLAQLSLEYISLKQLISGYILFSFIIIIKILSFIYYETSVTNIIEDLAISVMMVSYFYFLEYFYNKTNINKKISKLINQKSEKYVSLFHGMNNFNYIRNIGNFTNKASLNIASAKNLSFSIYACLILIILYFILQVK